VPIKNRQQLLTILTLTAVGLLAMDRVVRPPLQKVWKARADQIKSLQNKVKYGAVLQHGKESLNRRWEDLQKGTLPNDPTEAEQALWSGLNRWVDFSGVTLQNVSPTLKQSNDPAYKTLECRIDAFGPIERLSQFLYAMETDKMALRVQSIEMTTKDANGTSIGLGVQVSGLILASTETKK